MHYVYLIRCSDGTLYTGYTINIEKRIRQHNGLEKGGAKYTTGRAPVELVHEEEFKTKSEALVREAEIKKYTRLQKNSLIKGVE